MADTTLKDLTHLNTAGGAKDSDIAYIVRPETDADYKTSLGDLKTYSSTRKPQIIATHTGFSSGAAVASAFGSGTHTQNQFRDGHIVGPSDVSDIQIGAVGFYFQSNTTAGEVALGNSYTFEAAIEAASPESPQTRNTYFGTQKIATVESNSPLVLSNPVNFKVTAGSTIYVRQGTIVASPSDKILDYGPYAGFDNISRIANVTTSQIPNWGGFSGGVNGSKAAPVVLIGIPKTPHASVLVIGDSIAQGLGDASANARGAKGFILRALDTAGPGGTPIPWHSQALSNNTLETMTRLNTPKMRDTWKYCTHVLFQLGFNDTFTKTLAQLQAYSTEMFKEMKATIGPYGKPLHITCTSITPSASSGNSFTDATGQSINASFVPGGKRDQYNAWLQSQVGILIDQYIDLTPYTDDPAAPGKWYTNGTAGFPTTDGSHPAAGMVTRMSVPIAAWAAAIKP